MKEIERQVQEVLYNLNWLMEPHESYAELVEIKGRDIIIRSKGACASCETDCIGTAFTERLPGMNLVRL